MHEDIVISLDDILHFLPPEIVNEDVAQIAMRALPEFVEQMKRLLGFDGDELIYEEKFHDLIVQTVVLQAAHKATSQTPKFAKECEMLRQQKSISRDKLLNTLLFTDWHDSRKRMEIVDKLMWNPTVLRNYCKTYDKDVVLYDEEYNNNENLLNKTQKEAEKLISPELMEALVHDLDREQPEIHKTLVHKLRELIAAKMTRHADDARQKKADIMNYMMEHIDTPCLLYYKRSRTYLHTITKE